MTDLFPALATIYPPNSFPDQNPPYPLVGFSDASQNPYTECRVIVHNSQVFVGTDSPRGPRAVFQDTYQPSNVFSDGATTRVLTDTNYLVVFAPSKGCGCGSRLRSWSPYTKNNVAGSKGREGR